MTLPTRVTGLDEARLSLVSPAREDFDDLARPLLGRLADLALRLKPMLVIVSNDGPDTVVAFAVNFETHYPDGRKRASRVHLKCADAVCGDSPLHDETSRILPGESTVAANGCSVAPDSLECGHTTWLDEYVAQRDEQLENAVDLHIQLDAAIFPSGRLVGHDRSELALHFSTYVEAKQRWYRSVIEEFDRTGSAGEAFRPLRMFVSRRPSHDEMTKPAAIWNRQAAGDLNGWHRKHGNDQALAMARKALRDRPFVISR